mmetsp:Transcript_9555/g.14950  ORF Transcript_9555/g.14950 Transcript_9555/m.14950 type:complete len:93 (-) Transcript_9555:493-771(-)
METIIIIVGDDDYKQRCFKNECALCHLLLHIKNKIKKSSPSSSSRPHHLAAVVFIMPIWYHPYHLSLSLLSIYFLHQSIIHQSHSNNNDVYL